MMGDALKTARAVLAKCLGRHVFTTDEAPHIQAILDALAPVAAPPEELIEELRGAFYGGRERAIDGALRLDEQDDDEIDRAGIRAVLSHLARRGPEGLLPDMAMMVECFGGRILHEDRWRFLEECLQRFGPRLAARDAALAEARRDRDAYSTMLQSQAVELAGARAENERLRTLIGGSFSIDDMRDVEQLRMQNPAYAAIRNELDEARRAIKTDAEILRASLDTEKELCARLGALGAMLALYGLPSEPKALARELDGRRACAEAAEKKLAAVLALTADDLRGDGFGPSGGGIPGILALIRSRASEPFEPGPDPNIAATVAEHAAGPMPPAPDELVQHEDYCNGHACAACNAPEKGSP